MAHKSFILRYLWLLPFICFLAGYQIMKWAYQPHFLITPSLVGKTLDEAIHLAADQKLSLQLLADREEPDLPEGTILQQNPPANAAIKPHQPISCIISKKRILTAPNCLGKKIDELAGSLAQEGIVFKQFSIDSIRPERTCIAQDPVAGSSLESAQLLLYIAKQPATSVIVPRFTLLDVATVKEFLEQSNATFDIVHEIPQPEGHQCSHECIITDQRPIAGTIVLFDEKAPLHVQLIVGQ